MTPEEAYDKAKVEGPSDETREAASKSHEYAYLYALYVDKGPHEVTRAGASKYPSGASTYAQYVDEGPHAVTADDRLPASTGGKQCLEIFTP